MSKGDKTQHIFQASESEIESCAAFNTYGLNVLVAGVMDWLLHLWKTVSWRQSGGSSIGTVSRNGRVAGTGEGRASHITCGYYREHSRVTA